MPHLQSRFSLLFGLVALISLGLPLRSNKSQRPLRFLKSTMMASSKDKAAQLREYIFSQPASDLANNPWAVSNAIETFADTHGLKMIFRGDKLELARKQIMAQKPAPRTIIEFGTFVGKSALAWGAILRDIHGASLPADAKVYTFETDPVMVALARDLVKLAGLEGTVHVLEGPGSESLQKLVTDGAVQSVDMAFFDHWEEFYLPDLQLVERLKLWRVGSLAIADNTDYPGAPAYRQYVQDGGSGLPGAVKYESRSLETPGVKQGPVRWLLFVLGISEKLTLIVMAEHCGGEQGVSCRVKTLKQIYIWPFECNRHPIKDDQGSSKDDENIPCS